MDERGWHLDRQNDPDALHLMVSPEHDRFEILRSKLGWGAA